MSTPGELPSNTQLFRLVCLDLFLILFYFSYYLLMSTQLDLMQLLQWLNLVISSGISFFSLLVVLALIISDYYFFFF